MADVPNCSPNPPRGRSSASPWVPTERDASVPARTMSCTVRWVGFPTRRIRSMAGWTHRYARINGLDVHYVEQGNGPLVVLLHGFPHLWFSWRHQIGPIADAGFRVVAPDMRGMG